MLQPQDSKIKVYLTKCHHSKSTAITDEVIFKKHKEIPYKNICEHIYTPSNIYCISTYISTTYTYINNTYFNTHI